MVYIHLADGFEEIEAVTIMDVLKVDLFDIGFTYV